MANKRERKGSSLFDFDSDSNSSCSEKSRKSFFRNEGSDDDMSAFTVSTVLEKPSKSHDRSRRDTITRALPTISIHDKYTMPTAVDRKRTGRYPKEEHLQLRATSSLMDDSSDSDNDGGEMCRGVKMGITSQNRSKEAIFRTPSHDGQTISSTKSTTVRRNALAKNSWMQKNLSEIDRDNEGNDGSSNQAKYTNPIHSSDTFMSVYEDLSANRRTSFDAQTKTRYSDFTGRGTQVKSLVTTALRSVVSGLAVSNACDGADSWDVEKIEQLSGKKRPIDNDEQSASSHRQVNRRKSLNIRAELTLMQDMLNEKSEECIILKRKLEESQSRIQSLRNENSKVAHSKMILESKLDLAKEACHAAETDSSTTRAEAGAREELLSCQLRDSQSEVEGLRQDLRQKNDEVHTVKCRLQQAEYEVKKARNGSKAAEREQDPKNSRAELEDENDKMRNALKQIRELERVRSRKTRSAQVELQCAREALARAKSAEAEAESNAASLRDAVEDLARENGTLRAQLMKSGTPNARWKNTDTPNKRNLQLWESEWEEASEGIEVSAVKVQLNESTTLNTASLDHINSFGAEDISVGSKLPLKVNCQTTDSSSRQLSFANDESSFPNGKENYHTLGPQRSVCSLCFRPPRPYARNKHCQCGRDGCGKWAHASCLVTLKSVSNCVSHPGTPAPPLPTILCGDALGTK